MAQKGKKMRPMLLLLCAKLNGSCNQNTYRAATLVEVLHTATLIHDDVVDEAETRRGLPSLNSIWRNKVSVLIGDYLFSKALIQMVTLGDPKMLDLLAETADRLVTGEIDQIDRARSNSMTEEAYFRMIEDKTASLVATACKLGAMTTTDNEEHWQAVYEYGRNFGIAFQLKDDLFDFEGRAATVGKPIGLDLKHNMVTLPLIYAARKLGANDERQLRKILRRQQIEHDEPKLRRLVEETGGLAYARQQLEKYSQKAIQALDLFPDSPIKHSLIQFVKFNIQRQK